MDPQTWQIVADEWKKAGMSDHGIAGVLANIQKESNFDHTLRHPDQPRFGGEAHYAHGLYQEGGDEWNNYDKWLQGRNWQDPRLQSQFAAENLRDNPQYKGVWNAMMNASSPSVAASNYAAGYLKPARQYLTQRIADFQRNGVSTLDDWTSGKINSSTPSASKMYASSAVAPPLAAGNAPVPSSDPAPQTGEAPGSDTAPLAKALASTMERQPLEPPPMQQMQPIQRPPMSQMQAQMLRNMMAGITQDENVGTV